MMDARPGVFERACSGRSPKCFVSCQRRGNYNGWNSGSGRYVEDAGRDHRRAGLRRRGRAVLSLAKKRLAPPALRAFEGWSRGCAPLPGREGARRGVSSWESSERVVEHRVVAWAKRTVTVLQRRRYCVGGGAVYRERRALAVDRAVCPGSRSGRGMSEGGAVADRVALACVPRVADRIRHSELQLTLRGPSPLR